MIASRARIRRMARPYLCRRVVGPQSIRPGLIQRSGRNPHLAVQCDDRGLLRRSRKTRFGRPPPLRGGGRRDRDEHPYRRKDSWHGRGEGKSDAAAVKHRRPFFLQVRIGFSPFGYITLSERGLHSRDSVTTTPSRRARPIGTYVLGCCSRARAVLAAASSRGGCTNPMLWPSLLAEPE